jgi:hypothetical protein
LAETVNLTTDFDEIPQGDPIGKVLYMIVPSFGANHERLTRWRLSAS